MYGHPLEFRCEKPIMPTSARTPIVANGRTWHNGHQVMPSQHARVYFRFLKEEDGRVAAKDLLTGLILSQPHLAHTGKSISYQCLILPPIVYIHNSLTCASTHLCHKCQSQFERASDLDWLACRLVMGGEAKVDI